VQLSSSLRAETLFATLPIKQLKGASHKFHIENYEWAAGYASRILITPTANGNPFWLLKQWESYLGYYAVTRVEIAADHLVNSEEEALAAQRQAIATVAKPRHQRTFLWIEYDETQVIPPNGCLKAPTIYFEHANSTMRLKLYCRYDKRFREPFSHKVRQPLMRLEWSLKGSAIQRHLKGKQLDHLLNADLNEFVAKNLRVEQIDHVQLGRIFLPRPINARSTAQQHEFTQPYADPDYKARRAAFLVLHALPCRGLERFVLAGEPELDELASLICQRSPAHIRGALRELRDGKLRRRSGRPKNGSRRRARTVTNYKIDRCFLTRRLDSHIISSD
jgi:hypothetical protein